MPKLSEQELRLIIEDGETTTVELKVAPPRPAELAERLCGMANAQGGLIIIGVEDATLRIVGVSEPRMAADIVLRATRIVQPVLFLDPPEPEIYLLDGKHIVVITVPPSSGPIYQSSGVFWVRRGTYTIPLSVSEVLELANDRGLLHWELQPTRVATMKDIDMEKVEAYLSHRSARSRPGSRFDSLEELLVGMKCAIAIGENEIRPTNAGIMFFGRDPQWRIAQSEVVCVLFRDELGVGGYIDRKIIIGTLQELIDKTEAFLNQYIPVGAKIEGWKRIDLPDYPIEALREAVVNAVVHRDYSKVGESIRVFYYADRIEIHSPGLLLPGITIEQMEQGEVLSKLRNPVLANLLRDIPGYMERIGSGIRFMHQETRRMGLPVPQFKERGEFIVTFRKAVASTTIHQDNGVPQESQQHIVANTSLVTAVPQEREREERMFSGETYREQENRIAKAMRYVQEHGSITNREYRELTGASKNTAIRDLELLVKQGVLKSTGKTRTLKYILP